jgi:hypothetical protein
VHRVEKDQHFRDVPIQRRGPHFDFFTIRAVTHGTHRTDPQAAREYPIVAARVEPFALVQRLFVADSFHVARAAVPFQESVRPVLLRGDARREALARRQHDQRSRWVHRHNLTRNPVAGHHRHPAFHAIRRSAVDEKHARLHARRIPEYGCRQAARTQLAAEFQQRLGPARLLQLFREQLVANIELGRPAPQARVIRLQRARHEPALRQPARAHAHSLQPAHDRCHRRHRPHADQPRISVALDLPGQQQQLARQQRQQCAHIAVSAEQPIHEKNA